MTVPGYCKHHDLKNSCQICKIERLEKQIALLLPYLWHKPECRLFEHLALAKEEDCICGYFNILKAR